MNTIVAQIAKATGLDPGMIEKGLGILLSFMKSHSPEQFGQIIGSLPGVDEWMRASESSTGGEGKEVATAAKPAGAGGGLLGSLLGMFGGGKTSDAASLLGGLNQAGFSAESATEFLQHALKLIQEKLPPGTLDNLVKEAIPALSDFLKPATGPKEDEA